MDNRKIPAHEEDPRETPADDPRHKTDWPSSKQTDAPWEGPVEKEQRNEAPIDIDRWQETGTH